MTKAFLYGALALMCMTAGLTSCHKDPSFIKTPEIPVAPNTLGGIISDMQGNGIAGATVSLGSETTVTDGEGVYLFDNVAAGEYTISASAAGKTSVSATLTVNQTANTQNLTWNAMLLSYTTKEFNVTVDGGGEGEVESEALKDNDEGKVDIKVEVPENVVPENTRISVTPIYTESQGASMLKTRAENDGMLIGATLSCSDRNLRLNQDVKLTFGLDQSVATSVETRMLINGQWVPAPGAVVDGNVVISAREFTSYGVFLKVNVSTTVRTVSLVFDRDEWDNFYGDGPMNIGDATFVYKAGTEITSHATNKLEGLLIEYLARAFGATSRELRGSYPINIELPVGSRLNISGSQQVTAITVSGNSKSVTGTSYGTTVVQTSTSGRNHNGGGSPQP